MSNQHWTRTLLPVALLTVTALVAIGLLTAPGKGLDITINGPGARPAPKVIVPPAPLAYLTMTYQNGAIEVEVKAGPRNVDYLVYDQMMPGPSRERLYQVRNIPAGGAYHQTLRVDELIRDRLGDGADPRLQYGVMVQLFARESVAEGQNPYPYRLVDTQLIDFRTQERGLAKPPDGR